MLKLVRGALTAAVLTAIAVRLRRRARRAATEAEPRPHGPEPILGRPTRAERARYAVRGKSRPTPALLGVGALVAIVFGVFALTWTPGHEREEDPLGQQARDAVRRSAAAATSTATPPAVGWTPPPEVPDPNCRPERRPVAVRPLDPKVKRAVDRQWRRVERWLKSHAPRSYATLGRPGRARTIAVAESQMGVRFPDDLRASLLRHNGARAFGFAPWHDGAGNLGVREIRDTWRHLCRSFPTDTGPDPRGEAWNGRMIPFLSFQERQGEEMEYALIDSAVGDVGWDDTVSGMAFRRMPSYYALMRAVADALERGGPVCGARPLVEHGMLRWTDADLDEAYKAGC
ncbi:SMI1/KNR4 family protein [Nonomuraea sp. NPDC005983]|uniref:SMI1/KNR4 family protein n=1 Tax=Nonomuraea sp. NPDC005983 TaxID=3155595 RepID=UPI0033A46012